jgi:hypothetical protein
MVKDQLFEEEFEALSSSLAKFYEAGDMCNILAITRRNQDEHLHSRLIAYFLDPSADHGQADAFLKLFLEHFAGSPDFASCESAKVRREQQTDKGRKIDIVIETDSWIVGIENKWHAGDQHKQVAEYAEYLKSRKRQFALLYLTPDGDESPSAEGAQYRRISYKTDILSWLDRCSKLVEEKPRLFHSIRLYHDLICRLFYGDGTMDTSGYEGLLKKHPQVIHHLGGLQAAADSIWKKVRLDFMSACHSVLAANCHITKWSLIGDKPVVNDDCPDSSVHVELVDRISEKPQLRLMLLLAIHTNTKSGGRVYLGLLSADAEGLEHDQLQKLNELPVGESKQLQIMAKTPFASEQHWYGKLLSDELWNDFYLNRWKCLLLASCLDSNRAIADEASRLCNRILPVMDQLATEWARITKRPS